MDARLRKLERKWRESGDVSDLNAYAAYAMRAGESPDLEMISVATRVPYEEAEALARWIEPVLPADIDSFPRDARAQVRYLVTGRWRFTWRNFQNFGRALIDERGADDVGLPEGVALVDLRLVNQEAAGWSAFECAFVRRVPFLVIHASGFSECTIWHLPTRAVAGARVEEIVDAWDGAGLANEHYDATGECHVCGQEFETEAGVAHHLTDVGDIDHEADADHVPYATPGDWDEDED